MSCVNGTVSFTALNRKILAFYLFLGVIGRF
jgi:hypothetical protein